jgi:hypothetical protein
MELSPLPPSWSYNVVIAIWASIWCCHIWTGTIYLFIITPFIVNFAELGEGRS